MQSTHSQACVQLQYTLPTFSPLWLAVYGPYSLSVYQLSSCLSYMANIKSKEQKKVVKQTNKKPVSTLVPLCRIYYNLAKKKQMKFLNCLENNFNQSHKRSLWSTVIALGSYCAIILPSSLLPNILNLSCWCKNHSKPDVWLSHAESEC